VTLLELLVALALVGGMVALVAPALRTPPARGGQLESVLRVARSSAIARAQTLTLSIGLGGDWSVRPLPPGDSVEVLGGRLDAPPSAPFELQLRHGSVHAGIDAPAGPRRLGRRQLLPGGGRARWPMTLLEALLALVILGLSAVGYLDVYQASARSVRDAGEWTQVVALAESAMEGAT
jgi:type II secretory pathway pseudopilin PulG